MGANSIVCFAGSKPTSGGPPAAVQGFSPVRQLRSCRDEMLCPCLGGTETEGELGDGGGSTERHVPIVPLIALL